MELIRRFSGSHGYFGLRNLTAYMRDPLAFLSNVKERHGDVARFRVIGENWMLLSHPDDIEGALVKHHGSMMRDAYIEILQRALGNGLLTADGDLWKRQRKLASFAFTPKRIATYADAMVDVTERGIAAWRPEVEINLHDEMSRVTMEVVADVLFGANVGPDEVRLVRDSMEVINQFLASSPEAVLKVPTWFPTPLNYRFNAAIGQIDELIYRIINARRGGDHARNDLLDGLLAAQDEEGTTMSDQQLRDEVITLFLAGHETTALALASTFYVLSKHPLIAERLHAELDSVLAGRSPTLADLDAMPYLEKVLKESMRLYPPAWTTGRAAAEAVEINGHAIPKNAQILMSQWVVHRDPRWWPNPEAFDPERWTPEAIKSRPRYAYFPFGGGPRVCIGNHFAMMEAKLMIAAIASRWELHLVPGSRLTFKPSVTLRPAHGGVRVTLKPRAQSRSVVDTRPDSVAAQGRA